MTYRHLLEILHQLTTEELDQDATVLVQDVKKFFPVLEFDTVNATDILDKGRHYLVV